MVRVQSLDYVSFNRCVRLFPPSLRWVPWPLPRGSPAVPHLHRYNSVVRLLSHPSVPLRLSLGVTYLPMQEVSLWCGSRWGALLGSWAIPWEACPGLGTPATPARPCHSGRCRILPSAGRMASASQREAISELNPRGLLSCCVRFAPTMQLPDWRWMRKRLML